jgi:benzoate membrane transport protein
LSFKKLRTDFSLSAMTAGLVAVLIGYASAIVIVFQGAIAAGADETMLSSWVLALGLGMGALGLVFSWIYKMPMIFAWSTPGAALMAASLADQKLSDVIGAFIFVAILTIVVGASGWFSTMMRKIPLSIACAMLAGVLLNFGVDVFTNLEQQPLLVGVMIGGFLMAKRWLPRYAVIVLLLLGVGTSAALDLLVFEKLDVALATPVWVTPSFNWSVIIGIGLPLFVVTMTAQNMPGVAVLTTSGYEPPLNPAITGCGVATLLLAPFGGYTFNLAAITAALCTSADAHPDKDKRYIAGLSCGVAKIIVGLMGATVIALLASFPMAMITTLAGLALLSAIAASLSGAMAENALREPALITFLVTLSGVQFMGIAAAFWGIVAGLLSHMLLNLNRSHS